MNKLQQFVLNSIEEHLCKVSSNSYNQLILILGESSIKELRHALQTHQKEKFEKLLSILLENLEIQKALEMLMKKETSPIISKGFNSDTKVCTLFYGTNREPNYPKNPIKGYGDKRAKEIYFGSCEVSIPKSHTKGKIKGSLWEKIIHFDASYGDLKLQNISHCKKERFWEEIQNLLNPLDENEQEALIFIHGYNTSFEAAAIRAAQISVDLAYKGVTAFFSWPSKGTLLGYLADEASIQYSEPFITDFLKDFTQKSGAKKVNIIAHSMGNRGLLESVNRIQRDLPEIKFGQIILAAPDVDADVFEQLADAYTTISEQTTLYVSSADKAVGASQWIHAYNRAGFTPPVSVISCIDTVEVESKVNLLELGHGYFAEHKTLLDDIQKLFKLNLHASERALKEREVDKGMKYWKLKS